MDRIKQVLNGCKKHLKPLFLFIVKKEGMSSIPYPKVVFHTKFQDCSDPIIAKTAHFDPNTNKIHLFLCDNEGVVTVKALMRSFSHECIHLLQQSKGDIDKSGYKGDKITEDKNLIHLEEEAYLKGNMFFRSYTEMLQKKDI